MTTTTKGNGFNVARTQLRPGSEHRYREWMIRRVKKGHFSPLFHDCAARLGLRAAAVALHTVAVGQLKADPEGFVPMSELYLAGGIGLSAVGQVKALAKLERLHIAEVRHQRGLRLIRIDLNRLEEVVNE